MIIPVILSGGSGTRLWPLSREAYPKQFLPLVDQRTMLQNTALRIAGLSDVTAPLVVCIARFTGPGAVTIRLILTSGFRSSAS
ncbi:MAG: sugar phosphate nucleotidyltransferase [Candidatus Competibacteraceae bacterium]